jgi:hypothetical protein
MISVETSHAAIASCGRDIVRSPSIAMTARMPVTPNAIARRPASGVSIRF